MGLEGQKVRVRVGIVGHFGHGPLDMREEAEDVVETLLVEAPELTEVEADDVCLLHLPLLL